MPTISKKMYALCSSIIQSRVHIIQSRVQSKTSLHVTFSRISCTIYLKKFNQHFPTQITHSKVKIKQH